VARLSTCKGCDKQVIKEEKFIYSNKPYCKECYDLKLQEKQEYDNIINTVLKYFKLDVMNGMMLKQIRDYKTNFNYTYGGMAYCLWYLVEIKSVKMDVKYGLGLLKFEYENAKNYFLQQQSISNSVTVTKPVDNTVIKKIKIIPKDRMNKFLINLDELGGGDNGV
jgi:hypothetical protein